MVYIKCERGEFEGGVNIVAFDAPAQKTKCFSFHWRSLLFLPYYSIFILQKKNSFRHSFVNVLRSTGAFQRYRLEERENKEGKIENFIMTYCKVCAIVGSRVYMVQFASKRCGNFFFSSTESVCLCLCAIL